MSLTAEEYLNNRFTIEDCKLVKVSNTETASKIYISERQSNLDPIILKKSQYENYHSIKIDQESGEIECTQINDFPTMIDSSRLLLQSEHPKKTLTFEIFHKNAETKKEVIAI